VGKKNDLTQFLKMKNEKIGLLFRVSSKPQESDGGGLELQKRLGEKISDKLGLIRVEFNEGVQSSFKVEINQRPKLVELLDEIQKTNGIRKVWVFNTDRLGRYSNSWYSILKVFIDYGVEIYIGEDTKPYDLSSSVDKLTISVLSLISQYDNELRRMRSILGKRNSLKNGNTWVGGTVPFGFKVEGKMLVIHLVESQYVKRMFEMYFKGKSTMDIKVYLDEQTDIKPRRSLKGWNVGTVLSMLRKEIYKGIQVWEWKEKLPNGEVEIVDSYEVKHPKIITEKLWNSVQDKIDDEYPIHFDGKSRKSLLKGLLVCPKCNLKLGHRFKKNNHYYGRCSETNWRRVGTKINVKSCPIKKSPRMEELDQKVFDVVLNVIRDSSRIREEHKLKNLDPKFENEKKIKTQKETLERKIRSKKSEIKKVEEKEIEVDFDIRVGKISENKGELLTQKFKEHIEILNQELEDLQNKLLPLSNSEGWINWIERMNNELDKVENYSLEKKREFLKDILSEIGVQYVDSTQSHKIKIQFLLPLVGDSLLYGIEKDDWGFKTYELKGGSEVYETELDSFVPNTSKNQSYKEKLLERIVDLKEKQGLSLEQISNTLNKEGLKPLSKGKWYKSRLSSFYNYNRKYLPK
jgi:DNA invertase Pin-like site-specific DNA recombinase